MDATSSAPRNTVNRREAICAALEEHAPALLSRYDAAVRLVEDEAFPWRLRLVAHAVREIANALPELLLGLKAGRDSDAILEDVAQAWKWHVSPIAVDRHVSPAGAGEMPAGVPVPFEIVTKLDEYFGTRDRSVRRRDAAEALFAWSDPFNRAQRASLGPVLKAWLDAARWFVARAHAPRATGSDQGIEAADEQELARRFAVFESALRGLLDGFFAVQADIEAVVADRGPAGLDEILPLLAGAEQRRQFLNRLDDPAWIEPLEQRGFFATPEEPVSDADGSRHPVWPALRYLRRMATRPEAQEQVARIVAGVRITDNVTVRADIVDIALSLPPHLAVSLAANASHWLRGPGARLPKRLGILAERIGTAGHVPEALRLLSALLEFQPRPHEEGDAKWGRSRVEPHVHPEQLWGLVQRHVPALCDAAPDQVLRMLTGRLQAVLDDLRRDDDPVHEDHLNVWQHDVTSDDRASQHFGVLRVCTLRDAATRAVESGRLALSDVLAILQPQQWHVFKRLAMHLLERFADQGAGELARYLVDRSLLERLDAEYQRLLHRAFALLTPKQRKQILRWIEQGPAADQDGAGPAADLDAEDRRALDHWRWRRLGLVAADLPDDWQSRWKRLRDAFGEPPAPGTDPVRGSFGHVASESPIDAETLRALPVTEQVERIRAWRPSPEAPFVTYDELRQMLSRLVADDPAPYAAEAQLFTGLPSTIVRGFVEGLAIACTAQRPFPWEPALDLGRWIVAQPADQAAGTVVWGEDPGWAWTGSALARLLSHGFSTNAGAAAVPRELRRRTAAIITALMSSPPSGKEQALRTLIDYAMWVRREATESGGLGADLPEVERLLVAELGPDAPPETYRALGALLPWLIHLDSAWVDAHRDDILPAARPRESHWREAWSGFVRSHEARPHAWYPILRPEYARAVEDLTASEGGQDRQFIEECLAWHLLELYLSGDIDVAGSDPLMARFFEVAPLRLRMHLLCQAAERIENALQSGLQVIDRLMALWTNRVARAETEDRVREELPAFGWWFASGHFDQKWALEQLDKVLRHKLTPNDSPGVVKRLAELASAQPRTAARLLNLLADTPRAAFDAVLWLDDARGILAAAVRSDDDEAYVQAMAARDRLGKAGFAEIRQILPLSQDLDDPQAIPYFLWDEPMTVSRFRARLTLASGPERLRLLAKLLREARDTDVWRFATPTEVHDLLPQLSERLGRKRGFWEWLLAKWREKGLLARA